MEAIWKIYVLVAIVVFSLSLIGIVFLVLTSLGDKRWMRQHDKEVNADLDKILKEDKKRTKLRKIFGEGNGAKKEN